MCMHCLSGLNLLLALCSKYYSIQNFSIASLVLGEVIAQIWSLCSDWLCLFWRRCHDPHTRFLQKCLCLAQNCFQRFAMNNQLIVQYCLQIFCLILKNKMAAIANSLITTVFTPFQEKLTIIRGCFTNCICSICAYVCRRGCFFISSFDLL